MAGASSVIAELKKLGTPERAKASMWFFKTGKGQYGEGDTFIGVSVPDQRKIARDYQDITLSEIAKLLDSTIHECRLTALFILVRQYQKHPIQRETIAAFYITHWKHVNNWDLVDSSASYILGDYLLTRDTSVLYELARSRNLWKRRIAIIATGGFIKRGNYTDTLAIAEILLHDTHDLIHKAVGWMLREVGKRSQATEEAFLSKHAAVMPRTMLRYAIEKFPETKRKYYLGMKR